MSIPFRKEEGSQETTALIGYRCTCGNILSRVVLIARQLPFISLYAKRNVLSFSSSSDKKLSNMSISKILKNIDNGMNLRCIARYVESCLLSKEQLVAIARG